MEEQYKSKEDLMAELEAMRKALADNGSPAYSRRGTDRANGNVAMDNYNAIFNAANDAIFVHDIETLQIVDANQKACEMFLYTAMEMVGLRIDKLISDEDPYAKAETEKLIHRVAAGEPQLLQWLAKDKVGRSFWVEVNLKRAVIGGRYRFLSIVRDITDRKRTEERLTKINETFLSFGPDTAENISSLTKLCGTILGGDMAFYSRLDEGMLNSCGAWNAPGEFNPLSSPEGHICYDVIKRGKEDAALIRNLDQTEYAKSDPTVTKFGIKTYMGRAVKFGSRYTGCLAVLYRYDFVPTDEEKKIHGIIASAIGVEEERKSEEDSGRLAEFSIQRSSDSLFWVSPDAHILYVNDKVCQVLGYSREELLGMTIHDIDPNFPEERWPPHWNELKEKGAFTFESEHKRKDGTVFPVEVTVNYFEFDGNEYNFASARDITERRNSLRAIVRREYQLEILSRTSQHINAILEIPIIMRTLVAAAMELVDASSGMAGLVKKAEMVFEEVNSDGKLSVADYRFGPGEGLPGYILKEKKPCVVSDAASNPRVLHKKVIELGIRSVVCVPILNGKSELLGCFEIYNKHSDAQFDAQDVFMLQGLAASAAIALENAQTLIERQEARNALRKEMEFSESVINTVQAIVLVLDTKGGIVSYNNYMETLSGWPLHEVQGKDWFDTFLPEADKDKIRDVFDKAVHDIDIKGNVNSIITRKGELRYIEWNAKTLKDKDGKSIGIVSVGQDISDKKHYEEEQKRLNGELIRTNEKLENMVLIDPQTELYNHHYFGEVIEREFHRAARGGQPLSVILIDIDYFKSINDVYGHEFGDAVIKQLADQLRKMVRRYDVVIRFSGEEFVIISPGIERPRAINMASRILDALNIYNFGTRDQMVKLKLTLAAVSYPEDKIVKSSDFITLSEKILAKGKEEGGNRVASYLDIQNGKKEGLSAEPPDDVKLLKDKLAKLTKHGKQSLVESIFAFAKAIELKDHYTGSHVEHTVKYATNIAKELDLSPEEIENIKEASALHDLGKIGISDKILTKKSKLTDKEYEEIKRHPQIAADIIRPIQFMHDIIPLILYHHERWDGKGYPSGLRGDEIPIGARIIAIADVYQALTSNRPYRKAFSKREALNIIMNGAGTQFDPSIVQAFIKIIKKKK